MLRLPSDAQVRLLVPVDVRRIARLPPSYIGNALHLLRGAPLEAPPHAVPVEHACRMLRTLTAPVREEPARAVAEWLARLRELADGQLALEGAVEGTLALYTNFQAKLPMLQSHFGAGPVIRVVPGVGDTVQVVPAPAAPGERRNAVDVYLNLPDMPSRRPDWVEVAQSEAFKAIVVGQL